MHSSLMSSVGVQPEVARDNMGHATVDVTQNVYHKTWWEERVEAVSMAAASVLAGVPWPVQSRAGENKSHERGGVRAGRDGICTPRCPLTRKVHRGFTWTNLVRQ